MDLNHFIIATGVSLMLISCGADNQSSSVMHIGKRDNIVAVQTDCIVPIDDSLPIMHTCGITLCGDILLFDDHINDELKFTAYDISQGKVAGRFGRSGNGPGELANYGATFYDGSSNTLYVTEANQGKVFGFYLPDAISNPEYIPFIKAGMNFVGGSNAYNTPHYINDSTVICSTFIRDKETGSFSSHIGRLNLITQSVSVIDTVSGNDGIRYGIAVSPENMIYAISRTHDEIRIYDINGNLVKTIYGPDYEEKMVKRRKYFYRTVFCGEKILSVYAGGKDGKGHDIVVMDRDGKYVKTIRFSIPLQDIAYHGKTDRLYISTDATPQFGYIENFGTFIDVNVKDVKDDNNLKIDTAGRDELGNDKSEPIVDDGNVKCILSDPTAVAAAVKASEKSSTGPLTLIDMNACGAHVEHLKVGAYPEGDGEYLYTIGLFNGSDRPVEIASICLPDNYFNAKWTMKNILEPNMVRFLRLTCNKPLDNKEYPIVVHFLNEKYPPQTLCMTLYCSGIQLYNEMQSND